MITKISKKDRSNILYIINEASLKYKGVIPEDCWHEPYMPEQELLNEFEIGVRIFGYQMDGILVGVMGIQELEEVTLIRHAYILSEYQRRGIGKSLLQYLFQINQSRRLLVGTWQDATWAIEFYLKNGFSQHDREQTYQLLNEHWKVPLKQMENSVVLERR